MGKNSHTSRVANTSGAWSSPAIICDLKDWRGQLSSVHTGPRKGVAALLTADQALYDAWLDAATARSYLTPLEQFLGTGGAILAHQCRQGDLHPLFARALATCCHGGRNYTRRRCGRMTRLREEARVLPKQTAPRYAEWRNTAQTVERSGICAPSYSAIMP
jgi:hypothetical protein